jgi:thiamine kinase-like enzyme
METAGDHDHDVVQEEIVEKIEQVSAQVAEPKELSEEAVMNTKFTLSVQTMVGAGMGLASLIGMWYTLQGDIQEAKELPSLETLYQNEYPSRPEGHNWPRSYEQYKTQVGSLQEDMDDVYDTIEEMEELIKDLRKEISSLEKRKRDK